MKTMQPIPVKNRLILNVVPGKEYQVKIVDVKKEEAITEDFFYGVYCQAYREAQKIIIESDNKEKELQETANNIIAFCGERGQGKSSAMLSFSKLLKNSKEKAVLNSFSSFYNNFSEYEFKVLDRMDPTEFENCHSILSVIISRIFNEYQKEIRYAEIEIGKKNELLELFQQCYKDIDVIKDANSFDKLNYGYEDDLEELSMLSDSANIKSTFSNMVNKFLDLVCSKKNHFLVIQIDDTDLNVSKAYEIVEDIRKYFMIPNVIILMAVNSKLLINAIEQSFQKNFQLLMDKGVVDTENTHTMALKYINKLLPGSRRINLPEISQKSSPLDDTIELRYTDEQSSSYNKAQNELSGDIQDTVLRLIYEKTGIILIKKKETLHPIISKNTRALANFLSILNDMPNLALHENEDFNMMFDLNNSEEKEANKKRIIMRIANLDKFEEYFINTWVEENIGGAFNLTFDEWKRANYADKNKIMIYYLKNSVISESIICSNDKSYYESIYNNIEENFSVSKILDILNKIEKEDNTEKMKNLIFAIQTLYTITINKRFCYQILLEAENTMHLNFNISIQKFMGPILRNTFDTLVPKDYDGNSRVFFNSRLPSKYLYNDILEKSNINTRLLLRLCGELKNALHLENEKETVIYTFDLSQVFVELLQFNPFDFNNDDISFNTKLFTSRIACFQIISNIDIIEELKGYMIFPLHLRVQKDITKVYLKVYEYLQRYIEKLEYLPIKSISFEGIMELFKSNQVLLKNIYNYRELKFEEYSMLIKYHAQLKTFEKTYTIELLNERLQETDKVFELIKKDLPEIDLTLENNEIKNIIKNVSKRQTLAKDTCLQHQARLNKLIKSVKEKISNRTY